MGGARCRHRDPRERRGGKLDIREVEEKKRDHLVDFVAKCRGQNASKEVHGDQLHRKRGQSEEGRVSVGKGLGD